MADLELSKSDLADGTRDVPEQSNPRPPIAYSSPSAFIESVVLRIRSVLTRRFILSFISGQFVSLCITSTSVITTELVSRGWALPTTQSFFLYFTLFIIYTPYTIYKYSLKGWGKMVLRDGWKYFFLAACDVEANFLAVKAYQYTNLLSCMLLDAWAIPVCIFFSWLYMRPKYHWTQLLGVFIAIAGMGMQVASDQITDKDWKAVSKVKGDIFMLVAASLYGCANATEEYFVRMSPLYEVVGQLGMWGTLISATQASALEHKQMRAVAWNGSNIGLIFAFTVSMFSLYTVAPLLYRMASSAYFNLSVLTSDFYGLLFGLFLFHYKPFWLYFVSFVVTLVGLFVYFWHATPEAQGKVDPQAPAYVQEGQRQSEHENV